MGFKTVQLDDIYAVGRRPVAGKLQFTCNAASHELGHELGQLHVHECRRLTRGAQEVPLEHANLTQNYLLFHFPPPLGEENMRHAQSVALADRRGGAAGAAAREHQVGNAARCGHRALPVDHREVQGVLHQYCVQVSASTRIEATNKYIFKRDCVRMGV